MDQIQKVLVKAGRKDLAQRYYKKVSDKVGIGGPLESKRSGPFMDDIKQSILGMIKNYDVPVTPGMREEIIKFITDTLVPFVNELVNRHMGIKYEELKS